jgi:hypothetical protein
MVKSISPQQTARLGKSTELKQAGTSKGSSPLSIIESLGKLNALSSLGHPVARELVELAKGDKLSSLLTTPKNPKKAWMETLRNHGGEIVKRDNNTYDVVCPFNGDLLTLRQGLLSSDVKSYMSSVQLQVLTLKTPQERAEGRNSRSLLSQAAEKARSTTS